ncbi:alpha/beta hydrolase [Caldithrix abyssi]|nr:alpha/beta hydrolase [Caldithrix abyssi]
MIKKIIFGLVALVMIVSIVFVGWFQFKNIETEEIDDVARTLAPGKFVELSEGWTHYQIEGPATAPVVVLIHGFSVPYYVWDGTFETLVEAGFRVIRYDEYGRGYSDRPGVTYNGAFYEKQLLELLDALKIDAPIHLAGISMGGGVVGSFTAHYPEKVNKLVLVAPIVESRAAPSQSEFRFYYNMVTKWSASMAENQANDFKYPERFPNWVDRYRVQMKYKGFLRALTSSIYHHIPEDHLKNYEVVNKLGKEVLLIWGSEDIRIAAENIQTLRQMLDAEFFLMEDVGHIPNIESPIIFNNKLISFLKSPVKMVSENELIQY